MAETLLSPGVLARENDQSFITQGPIEAGAAIIGPTVKGPVGLPTLVTSYSDFTSKFGTTFTSASNVYSYFTSVAAYNYFNNGGASLLVTRVTPENFTAATSTDVLNNVASIPATPATGSGVITGNTTEGTVFQIQANGITYNFIATGSSQYITINTGLTQQYPFASGSTNNQTAYNLATAISSSIGNIFTATTSSGGTLILSASYLYNGVSVTTGSAVNPTIFTLLTLGGGTAGVGSSTFQLETLSKGDLMNNSGSLGVNGILSSGSADNVRWQIVAPNTGSGTFTLLIRQGNDTGNNPIILEQWSNISLDPYAPNYIESVIGNQGYNIVTDSTTGDTYIQTVGQYTNKSRYVRVKTVNYPTPGYLDNNGNIGKNGTYSASIPLAGSGSFTGATGKLFTGAAAYYQNVTSATNIQGLDAGRYTQSINLLSNTDNYKFNVITTPGLTLEQGSTSTNALNQLILMCQNRGDALAVVDSVNYGANIGTVIDEANAIDNSYAATYWPWLQVNDPGTGQLVWVPASTQIPGVYAFTDSVSEPWFAPAGINRGGLGNVVQAERKLSQSDRDSLYLGRVNPIATFPGTGVVVYGQKTLQKKASALDRVNVRRLLIALKSYISQVANTLVFEQNTAVTRNNFLAQVNPYLESVQQRQGLYAFKVVMDDTNNTPDVIDRNQLVGQIFLQPTKTAEYIILDFNVLPTGATFG